MQGYEIIKINENTWRIEEGMVRFFLLTGSKKALLIDSGMSIGKAREAAESITTLPVELLNTHADPDHTGSNDQFAFCYMSEKEENNYRSHNKNGQITYVKAGDIIDLGDRPLEIIEIPGHTPGSIGVLDSNKRFIISGDPVQDSGIYMFGKQRNLPLYIEGLKALEKQASRFDELYPSHGTFPVKPALIGELIAGAEKVLNGEIEGVPADMWGTPIRICDIGCAKLLCDVKKILS